jgi:hypothetical protein
VNCKPCLSHNPNGRVLPTRASRQGRGNTGRVAIEPILDETVNPEACHTAFLAAFGNRDQVITEVLFEQILNVLHSETAQAMVDAVASGERGMGINRATTRMTKLDTTKADCMREYDTLRLFDGTTVKVHPAATRFPLMTDAELDQLAADIAKHGLQQPLAFIGAPDGLVLLDGRNRLLAIGRISDRRRRDEVLEQIREGKCRATILDVNVKPVEYVTSANLHRRHLTAEQKREVVAALLTETPQRSDRETAKIAKVDHKTVAAVRVQAVANGEIPHRPAEERIEATGRKARGRKPGTRVTDCGAMWSPLASGLATKALEDPVERLGGIVKDALAVMTVEQQDRALSVFNEVARALRDERRYAAMAPEVADRRYAIVKRVRRHREKRKLVA